MILKRNFAQFQANKNLPELTDKVAKIRIEIERVEPRCPEKKNDFSDYMVFYRKKEQLEETMHRQMDEIRFGMRGRKNRVFQAEVEKKFSDSYQELQAQEKNFICGNCHSRSKCISRYFQAARLEKKLNYWRGLLEEQGELQLPLYERKLELLRRLGYIDDKGLLPRGELASRIHTEEIAVTELYFHGYFHECNEHELNALCLSLIYEHRRRAANGEQARPPAKLPEKIKSARGFINSLARQHPFIKPLETRICHLMIAWSEGAAFEEIMSMTEIPEGDLIRAFRQVIDLLRQIRDAVKEMSLRDKLLSCLACINRDIVLATELRD